VAVAILIHLKRRRHWTGQTGFAQVQRKQRAKALPPAAGKFILTEFKSLSLQTDDTIIVHDSRVQVNRSKLNRI
jgi:hypothetical protein